MIMEKIDLTENELIVYGAICRAADNCEPCPKAEDLQELTGVQSVSTTVKLVGLLEKRGMIEVERFQRGRRVRIVETNRWTSMPINIAPHWRTRPRDIPSASVAVIRERKPDTAKQIEKWAIHRGVAMCDALADLVFIGWEVEKERG